MLKNVVFAKLARLAATTTRMLPLHEAAGWKNTAGKAVTNQLAMTEHLLKVYPEAAYVRDSRDRLPLHLAIRAKAPLSMVQLLLDANQASGEANYRYKNEFLNFPPALIASASECDLDVVFTLLRFVPSIAKPLGGGETSISTTTKRKRS
jgi:hypothetical protein